LRAIGPTKEKPVGLRTLQIRPDVRNNLRAIGFKPSIIHSTVGKLEELFKRSPEKYKEYIGFFEALYEDLQLYKKDEKGNKTPTLIVKLLLPPAEQLDAMDVKRLTRFVSAVRLNFFGSTTFGSSECDLRRLLNYYPNLEKAAK